MGNSCVYLPKRGKKTFVELKNRYGYEKSAHIYNIVSRQRFIDEFRDSLVLDEDGIPTFESLMKNALVRGYLTERTIIEAENKRQPHLEDTIDNTKTLIGQAIEYNKNNDKTIALVDWDENGKLTLNIVSRNAKNEATARVQKGIMSINNAIIDMLSSVGITIGQLMDIERGAGRVGIINFNNAKSIGEEFVNLIRVANNMEGYKAISEEFSHLLVRAYHDTPLMKRAILYYSKEDKAREVLGDEYDKVYQFYGGNMDMVAEEAAGQALQNAFIDLEANREVKVPLIKRLINNIVNFFKGLNPATLQNNLDNIEKELYNFARDTRAGKNKLTKEQIESLKSNKIFNSLSKKAEIQMDKLKEISLRFSKVSALRTNLDQLRENEDVSQKAQAYNFYQSVKKEVGKGRKTEETIAAIYNVLQLSMGELKSIYKSIQNIDNLSEKDKFTVFMNCLNTAKAFAPTIAEIKDLLTNEYLSDEQIANQKFVVGDIENDLHEFEDEINEAIDTEGLSNEEIANRITKESNKWKLSDNKEYYVNTETGAKAKRVTDTIQHTEDGEEFDKNSPWITPSTNIGTGIDNFVRDFFSGKLDGMSDAELEENYPNAKGADLASFRAQLKEFKESLDAKGITIIPRDVTVNGTIETIDGKGKSHKVNVVGTLDLIGYDKDGNWHIYDMKTHHSNIKNKTKEKYARQLSLYKKFIEDKYGVRVTELNVIPIKVSYPTPKGASTKDGKGTTEYTAEKNNQLTANGEEFRGANPRLEKLLPIEEVDVDVEYSKLSGDATNGLGNAIKQTIDAVHTVDDLYSMFMNKFSTEALSKFVDFIKLYLDEDDIMVKNKNGNLVRTSIESVLKNASSDTTTLQYWLTAMEDNPDIFLQIFDKIYKRQLTEKRLNTIEVSKKIMALGKEFEAKGIKDYSFMFEDDKRHYVGVDIRNGVNVAYNQSAYEKAKKEYYKTLDEKYGKYPTIGSKEYKEKKEAMKKWVKENSIMVTEENGFKHYVPSYKLYPSKYDSFTATQKEFYNRWLEIKEELDSKLPGKTTTLFSSIKIRKSMMERSKDALLKGDFASFGEELKSKVIRSFDDDVVYTEGIKGFNGEELLKLPTYYVNENPNLDCSDLSTDVIGTLCAYAEMCNNYEAMNEVLNPLEIGRWLAYNVDGKGRTIRATQGGKPLMERWRAGGKMHSSPLTIDVNQSTFKKTLDEFFNSKIYQRYYKDSGEVGGVDVNKTSSLFLKLGSMAQLGFNLLANLANVGTGVAMFNIEAAGGEFFNASELASADAAYIEELGSYFSDIGQRVQDSWLSLFDEMFDIKKDFSGKIKNKDWLNRTIITRVFGPGIQFIGQEMGDHWLYNRAALAIATRTKLLDTTTGKKISLREALVRVPVDKDKPELGYKMEIKQGVTNLDGTAFSRRDIANIADRMHWLTDHLFGIYNPEDALNIRHVAWGRFIMQYRDFIPAQFRYRFGTANSNLAKGGVTEGYYVTSWNVGKQLFDEVLKGDKTLKQVWGDLDDYQRANCRKAIAEVSQFLVLCGVITLLGNAKDKDRSWAESLLRYWAIREKTELGVLLPAPSMVTEGIKIVKSPVANSSIWSDIVNLQNCLWVPNWFDEIENGEYKGHSSAYRAFMRSPATLWYRTIKRSLDPEKASQFYDN